MNTKSEIKIYETLLNMQSALNTILPESEQYQAKYLDNAWEMLGNARDGTTGMLLKTPIPKRS